ncbi:hypothetical protein ABH944_006206 [Caballeronia udeis]|uniref:Uncharacterized protein n=1 Tax=Caballeronia udeis TaxID=1232866 RepID=A0ABW8MUM2_9BURK
MPRLSSAQRQLNLQMLCYISQDAAEHGVDFILGVWEFNAWSSVSTFSTQTPTADGITDKNIGPYIYAALKKVLQQCPAISSVQIRTNSESGIPAAQQVSFFRDWIYRAIREAGRPVTLDLRGWVTNPEILNAAVNAGIPLRLSTKY